jgi:hypothetical protein
MTPHHQPVTRLQIIGFLATSILLGGSICTAFIFALLGNPLEATLGVAGVVIAAQLCRLGRKKWNFDRIDAAGSRFQSAYVYDEAEQQGYYDLLKLIDEVNDHGWQNLDLESKADARERLTRILEKEPLLAEEVLAENAPEHLRYVARQYLPAHGLS